MKPGTIVWVDLNPTIGHEQQGHRPALVISEPTRTMAIVVPMTSTPPKHRAHYAMRSGGGRVSTALCEQVRSIDLVRVTGTRGYADAHDLAEVRWTVGALIGLPG